MSDTIISTVNGKLEGFEQNGILKWLGIPYAKPPTGTLRYKRTVEPEPWKGILQAIEFGPRPFQFMDVKSVKKMKMSEDCLHVNIWAPGKREKCPVFVYFYGGANTSGESSDPMYDGTSFAEKGIIYACFNYRLGPLGFYDFSIYDDSFDSNCGLSDQIAGLRWVKNNIEAFGGDPDNITICGESAGGTAVYDLLAAPSAKGLFKRAIAMSGLPDDAASPRQNKLNVDLFLQQMNILPENIKTLKTIVPAEMIPAAGWMFSSNNSVYPGIFVPGPVIDDLLPQKPWEAMKSGSAEGIDCIFGTCRDEASIFYLMKILPTGWDEVKKMLELSGCPEMFSALRKIYSAKKEKEALQKLFTDRLFRAHSVMCADAQSSHGKVYVYRNDFEYPALKFAGLGAMHGSDVGMALNTSGGTLGKASIGTSKKRKARIRKYIHETWVNFSKMGNPNGTLPIEWKLYDTEKKATMIFNDVCTLENNPGAEAVEIWKDIKLYE